MDSRQSGGDRFDSRTGRSQALRNNSQRYCATPFEEGHIAPTMLKLGKSVSDDSLRAALAS